jgi:hypothetical protein
MQVWILNIGNDTVVAENFRNIIRHAAVHLFPDEGERERAREMHHTAHLREIGAAGSFAHYLRYHNDLTSNTAFNIEEHQAGLKPGEPSLVRRFDCNGGIDPSYFLQRAVWNFTTTGELREPDVLATALKNEITDGLTKLRATQSDDKCVDDLRALTSRFSGPAIIPQFGSASRVLDLIPQRCASTFIEIAEAIDPSKHP